MDTFTTKERSEIMRKVKSTGNRSTEGVFIGILRSKHISGWKLRPKGFPGSPDIVFSTKKVLVFLDGCFLHGCSKCFRAPSSRKEYWKPKIERNKNRDKKITRSLRRKGYSVLRIREHEIKSGAGFNRLVQKLNSIGFN